MKIHNLQRHTVYFMLKSATVSYLNHTPDRPVTSLGHQWWRRVFWECPEFI